MTFGTTILNHNGTAGSNSFYVYNNDLGAPGYTAPGYANGVVTLTGVTTDNVANTGGVTQNLQGWGDYVINGAITSPVAANGLPLNITKNGIGILTLLGATGTGTGNGWTAGTLSLSAGTTRLTMADQIGTGGATLTLSGGLLELRSDTSLNFDTKVGGLGANSTSTVFVDHSLTGTSTGGAMSLGTVAANNTATVNVVGDRGNTLTLGLITVTGTKTFTLNNYLSVPGYSQAGYVPGVLNLSGLTTDNTATAATIVLGGLGDFNAFDGTTNADQLAQLGHAAQRHEERAGRAGIHRQQQRLDGRHADQRRRHDAGRYDERERDRRGEPQRHRRAARNPRGLRDRERGAVEHEKPHGRRHLHPGARSAGGEWRTRADGESRRPDRREHRPHRFQSRLQSDVQWRGNHGGQYDFDEYRERHRDLWRGPHDDRGVHVHA